MVRKKSINTDEQAISDKSFHGQSLQIIETIKQHPEKAEEGLLLLQKVFERMDSFRFNYNALRDRIDSLVALGDATKAIKPELFETFLDTAYPSQGIDVDAAPYAVSTVGKMIANHPESSKQMLDSMVRKGCPTGNLTDFVKADKILIPEVLEILDTHCRIGDPNKKGIGAYFGSGRCELMEEIVKADATYIPDMMQMANDWVKNDTMFSTIDKERLGTFICAVLDQDKKRVSDCFNLIKDISQTEIKLRSPYNRAQKTQQSADKFFDSSIPLQKVSVYGSDLKALAACIEADPGLSYQALNIIKNKTKSRTAENSEPFSSPEWYWEARYLEPLDTIISHSPNKDIQEKAKDYKFDLILRTADPHSLAKYAFDNPLTDDQRCSLLNRSFELIDHYKDRVRDPKHNFRQELLSEGPKEYGTTLGKYTANISNIGYKSTKSIQQYCKEHPHDFHKEDYDALMKKTKQGFITRMKGKLSR